MLRRAAVLLLAIAAGCATPSYVPAGAPRTVDAPSPRTGESWEYAVRDAYSGAPRGLYRHQVVRADPQGIVVDVYRDGRRVDAYVFAPGWNPLEMPLTN